MRLSYLIFAICLFQNISAQHKNYQLANVNFFGIDGFTTYDKVYINQGRFSFKEPRKIDTIINLSGKYVLPPFVETHTHKLDKQEGFLNEYYNYISEGTFYALVLNNRSSLVKRNRQILDSLNVINVLYANGGITSTGAHPSFAYERNASGIEQWWLPENTEIIKKSKKLEKDAYWFFDSEKELNEQWANYLAIKPDLVKIYLMDVKSGNPSLSESTARKICELAHQEGLRVVAHIETFDDLKIGLSAGVDIFAHLPHYNVNYTSQLPQLPQFTNDELKYITQNQIQIVSTLSLNEDNSIIRTAENNYEGSFDQDIYNRVLNFQKKTVYHLIKSGFKFALGSDGDSFRKEIDYWLKNEILSPQEILFIATYRNRKLVFPEFDKNRLTEGMEASLLVLNENPLSNYDALDNIDLMIKKGKLINVL